MSDEPGISPIPIGGNVSPSNSEADTPESAAAPVTEPIPIGAKTTTVKDADDHIQLQPEPSSLPPGPEPVALPEAPVAIPAPSPPAAETPAPAVTRFFHTHAFTSVAGLALLLTALFVPHWDWAKALADASPNNPTAAWLAEQSGSSTFAGNIWEALRAALLTAIGGIAAFALYRRHQKFNTISRVILHVALTSLSLILLGIVIKSLGSDSTRWDFADILSSAGLVYPVVALFWSRPRWAQLLLATFAFGISWYAATQATPEDFTAAQASLLPILPALGLMLLGLAAGEALLRPHVSITPGKTAAWTWAVFAAGVATIAIGWALHHFGIAPARLPDAPLGTLLLGSGTAIALAAIFHLIPRKLLPFNAIGTYGIAFYIALHTLAPSLHSIFETHLRPGYLSLFGTPSTPLIQNILITAILWIATSWLASRKTASS